MTIVHAIINVKKNSNGFHQNILRIMSKISAGIAFDSQPENVHVFLTSVASRRGKIGFDQSNCSFLFDLPHCHGNPYDVIIPASLQRSVISLALPFLTSVLCVLLDLCHLLSATRSVHVSKRLSRVTKVTPVTSRTHESRENTKVGLVQETVESSTETTAEEPLPGPSGLNGSILLPTPDADDDSLTRSKMRAVMMITIMIFHTGR